MTVNEVIKRIIPVLEGIKVPMTEIPTIGIPVSGAINDLKQCVAFMDRVEQEASEKAEQEDARAAAEQEDKEKPEESGETERTEETEEARNEENDLFGEKAGGENDERTYV